MDRLIYTAAGDESPARTAAQARVLVDGAIQIVPPKSRNGFRTLPLDVAVASALHALKVAQSAEKLAAGRTYVDDGHVVVDELGEPVHPEWYSDESGRLAKRAWVKRIVLHDGRHTTLSLMEKAGCPSRSSAGGPGTTTRSTE